MKFEYFKRKTQWYFRLRSRNGKVICQSEGYKRKVDCLNGIRSVQESEEAPFVEVEE